MRSKAERTLKNYVSGPFLWFSEIYRFSDKKKSNNNLYNMSTSLFSVHYFGLVIDGERDAMTSLGLHRSTAALKEIIDRSDLSLQLVNRYRVYNRVISRSIIARSSTINKYIYI